MLNLEQVRMDVDEKKIVSLITWHKVLDMALKLQSRVEQQAARIAELERFEEKAIRARDNLHDMADKLAEGIAEHFNADIGEHSSANCPWTRALELLNTKPEFSPCAGSAQPSPAVDLSRLTRYDSFETDEGDELRIDSDGRWVRFDDVQSLLSSAPVVREDKLTDDRIYDLVAEHEKRDSRKQSETVFSSIGIHAFARSIEREVLATSHSSGAAQAWNGELPELPVTHVSCQYHQGGPVSLYDANQMRAYARKAIGAALAGVLAANRDAVREAASEALASNNTYFCNRVWSAWQIGTMGEDDFQHACTNGDLLDEITDAVLEALKTNPASQESVAVVHDSDCSLHNAPALPVGPCDCSVSHTSASVPQGWHNFLNASIEFAKAHIACDEYEANWETDQDEDSPKAAVTYEKCAERYNSTKRELVQLYIVTNAVTSLTAAPVPSVTEEKKGGVE